MVSVQQMNLRARLNISKKMPFFTRRSIPTYIGPHRNAYIPMVVQSPDYINNTSRQYSSAKCNTYI